MKHFHQYLLALGGAGLVAAGAACSHDLSPTASAGLVPAAVKMASTSASTGLFGAGMAGDTVHMPADSDDGHGGMLFLGRLSKSDVDSLSVNVTKVEVLAVNPDSENAADSAAEAKADSGKHEDTDADDDHENDERTWVSLDVTAGGHLDLLNLPDSAQAGITIATGALPAGKYKHVRLFVTDATIYLKNQIVTPTGDTLKAGVALPVMIPSADSTGAAIKTDEKFTLTSGSSTVQLFFDADDTIRHIVLTADGKIVVPPVMH